MGLIRRFVALSILLSSCLGLSAMQSVAAPEDDAAAGRSTTDRGASLPRTMRFTGVVRGADDAARSGVVTLTFTLYSEPQGGSPVWVETQNVSLDENGRYTALLGTTSHKGLPVALFAHGEARWLGVRVAEEGAAEQARVQLVSVPYALAAADAQSLGGRPATDFQLTRTAAIASGDGQAPGPVDSAAINNGSTNGTVNFLPKFDGASTIVNSAFVEVGGRFGLGTTTPNFQIDIQNADASAAGANLFRIQTPSVNGATMHFISTSANGRHWGFGSNFILGTGEFGIYDYTAGASRLYIDNAGRVGLGTTSPGFLLDIRNTETGAGGAALMRLQTPSTNGALIRFVSTSANGHEYGFGSNFILGAGEFGIYDYTANASRLMVSGTGNVGVGTSTPSQKLEVAGMIYSSTGGIRFPDNTVQTTAATGGGAGDITGVTAGNGMAGGGLSGDVTLNIKTCTEGQILKYVGTTWTCSADQSGAGGIVYPYSSGNQSTPSGAFVVTQTNSVLLGADPTFASAQSTIPAALVGVASATTNTAAGVVGFSSSISSPAIVGWNGSTTGSNDTATGVLGITDNPLGRAIEGEANALSGNTVGVRGKTLSTSGTGVVGNSNAASGNTIGVQGEVSSTTGTAGYFSAPNGTTSYILRGGNFGPDVFKVDGNGTVFAAAYKDLAGNPIGAGGGGTVTSITAGTGLSGGTINTSGTISLNTSFTDGLYARLAASNTFSGAQNSFSGSTVNPIVSVTQNGTGSAVQGLHNAGGIGVFGSSSTSMGVQGNTNAGSTTFAAAVRGVSTGAGGIGVYGQQNAATGTTIGVKGSVLAATGIAGVFDNQAGGQILSGQASGVEKFAVNNSGVITTKSVSGASMASDTLSLPAAAFSGLSAKVTANGALDNNQSATNKGWHSVTLPSGVVITSLRICGRDFDDPGQIVAKLYRRARDLSVFSAPDQIATVSSGTTFFNSAALCFTSSDLNATFATVSNSSYTYFVQLEMTNFVQVNVVEIVY